MTSGSEITGELRVEGREEAPMVPFDRPPVSSRQLLSDTYGLSLSLAVLIYFASSFFPLDEATASGAVFVIVSGSYGRGKCFWSQLNNSER